MAKQPQESRKEPARHGVSRREVLIGAAATALATASMTASARQLQLDSRRQLTRSTGPIRRYMAAAAVLGDGRVLVTGGYSEPFRSDRAPAALNTAQIYDPGTGEFTSVAPMTTPRARHAAVALKDGRVAVLGGTSLQPTASVEIFDPSTNTWTPSRALQQPRFDHVAVMDGDAVIVLGGTSLNLVSSVERVFPSDEFSP